MCRMMFFTELSTLKECTDINSGSLFARRRVTWEEESGLACSFDSQLKVWYVKKKYGVNYLPCPQQCCPPLWWRPCECQSWWWIQPFLLTRPTGRSRERNDWGTEVSYCSSSSYSVSVSALRWGEMLSAERATAKVNTKTSSYVAVCLRFQCVRLVVQGLHSKWIKKWNNVAHKYKYWYFHYYLNILYKYWSI